MNKDTDVALTTRELAKMISEAGIDFNNIPDGEYDNPFEIATGAGAIFGATGGVMEAALRTAAVKLGGEGEPLVFSEVRGTEGVKEAEYTVGGVTVSVAVASGLGNARKVMEMIKSGEKSYKGCNGGNSAFNRLLNNGIQLVALGQRLIQARLKGRLGVALSFGKYLCYDPVGQKFTQRAFVLEFLHVAHGDAFACRHAQRAGNMMRIVAQNGDSAVIYLIPSYKKTRHIHSPRKI